MHPQTTVKAAGHSAQQRVEDEMWLVRSDPVLTAQGHCMTTSGQLSVATRVWLGKDVVLATYGLGLSPVFTVYPFWPPQHIVGGPQRHWINQTRWLNS